jgi:hypothetical protein
VHFSQYIKISEEKYRNLYNKLVISQWYSQNRDISVQYVVGG